MRIKTTVIDDDTYDLNRIQNILNRISSETIYQFSVSLYSDPDSIPSYNADWYVVDIDLNGKSGFDVANVIKSNDPSAKIIFWCPEQQLHTLHFMTESIDRRDIKEEVSLLRIAVNIALKRCWTVKIYIYTK